MFPPPAQGFPANGVTAMSRRISESLSTMEPTDALHDFRRSFYECLHRRGDALFELTDAILAADGAAPSPAHLSLQASHRRG